MKKMFILEGKEFENFKRELHEHYKTCKYSDPRKRGAIGGNITFCFTPTSIGTYVRFRCSCDPSNEINLTNLDDF